MSEEKPRYDPSIDYLHPFEVDVPASYETFAAQVLVTTLPSKQTIYPLSSVGTLYIPMQQASRVLESGKFTIKLVPSAIANGRPTLLITETGDEDKA